MNAKVGSAENRSDKNLSLYGKGQINSNGQILLYLARLTGPRNKNTLCIKGCKVEQYEHNQISNQTFREEILTKSNRFHFEKGRKQKSRHGC